MKVSRQKWLGLAAAMTLVLVALTAWRDESGQPAEASTPRKARPVAANQVMPSILAAGTLPSNTLDRYPLGDASADPFRVVSFLPIPPKTLAPQPMPTPPPLKLTAPTFPYRYFGKMIDTEGKLATYLTRDDVLIPIHASEVLGNLYRIDALSEDQIVISYLPLDEKVIITTRSAAQ